MSRKEYKVTGNHAVLGHEPGETFTKSLPPDQEQRLLGRGAIKVVQENDPRKER